MKMSVVQDSSVAFAVGLFVVVVVVLVFCFVLFFVFSRQGFSV